MPVSEAIRDQKISDNQKMGSSLALVLKSRTFTKALCGLCGENLHASKENNVNAKVQTLAKNFTIDSGTTHHTCYSEKFYQILKTVLRYHVSLGDSRGLERNKMGEVDIVLDIKKKNAIGS